MATTNAFSNVYLADGNGANVIYLDADPVPFPIFSYQHFGRVERTVPTRSGGVIVSGKTVVYDTGSDLTSVELDLHLPYVVADTFQSLVTKFLNQTSLRYSPDNGTTIYVVAWRPGPLGLTKPDGWANYTGTLKLQVVSQLVGSGGVGGPGGGG